MKPVFLPNGCLRQPKQVAKESTCIHDNDTVDGRNPAPVDMADIPVFTGFMGFIYLNWCSKFHHEYHDTKTNYELREKKTYLQFRHVGIFLSEIPNKCKEMNLCRSDVHLSSWSIIIYQAGRVETIKFLDVSDCLETIHVLWRNMIRGAPVVSHGFWFETRNVTELTRLQVREWILIDWLSYVQAKEQAKIPFHLLSCEGIAVRSREIAWDIWLTVSALFHWLNRTGVARAIATDGCIFPISSTNTCHNSQQSPLITIMRPKMLQMMKSKQSKPSQVNTLCHKGISLLGGCRRYTQFWTIFQPCKGFFMASLDPALAHINYLCGTSKSRHCTSTRAFFAPALHKSLRLPNVKQVAKQNPFQPRTLRFGPWFSLEPFFLIYTRQTFKWTKPFLGYWQIGKWLWCFREKNNACLHHLITSIITHKSAVPTLI